MATGPSPTETRHLRTLFELGAVGTLTDGQLLERFAIRGDEAAELAFAALVERHGSMVLRVARSVLGDDPSAHDAFQATFLILARKSRSLWVRDSLGPWLHAVAFRVATRSRAVEARRKVRERIAARPESIDFATSDRDDLTRAIHEEIERLPEPYRAAVVTCHLEGLTQIDAARSLGWPVGTLQSRLARGRQRLRDRLKRRGLAPSLASLAGKLGSPPDALTASTARASAALQAGRPIAGMIAPSVLAMIDATSKGMLMTKLKFGAVALVILGGLVASTATLGPARAVQLADEPSPAPRAEGARVAPPRMVDPGQIDNVEPALYDLTNPKPWETVVRIKIHLSDKEWGFGSGTIISSWDEEAIILTSAHIFQVKQGAQPAPKDFRVPISVDLFGGEFARREPAMLACTQKDIPGEVIGYDFTDDVGLIRIRPGRKLPASRVVPTWWKPQKNMKMFTVGCSQGNDATAWNTRILNPRVEMTSDRTRQGFATIKCAFQPAEGRAGGGLYTSDGFVAGVCLFADPNEQVGLYASPEAIHKFLKNLGLVNLYVEVSPTPTRPTEPRLSPVPDRTSTPGAIRRDVRPQAETTPTPALEPSPSQAVSEQDRRIDALERKLDRLIEALGGDSPKIEGSFPGKADPLKPRR